VLHEGGRDIRAIKRFMDGNFGIEEERL